MCTRGGLLPKAQLPGLKLLFCGAILEACGDPLKGGASSNVFGFNDLYSR